MLLVDAYDTVAEEANGSTVIPDSAYTNVLASAGISYGFWKVNARGYPQLADLQPFPVVIWRITDDIVNYGVDEDGLPDPTATNNTLNAQQQFMIQTYLNGGGSFFMASMGILSQLGDVPFARNVLQVAGFTQNPDPPAPCSDCDEDFGVPAIFGAPASVASGMNVTLDYSNYPSFDRRRFGDVYGPDFSDTFTPSSNATAITFESVSGKPCGMSYPNIGVDSPGRVVFLVVSVRRGADQRNRAEQRGRAAAEHRRFPRARRERPGRDFSRQHGLYDQRRGDGGGRRFGFGGRGPGQASFVASSRTNRTTVTLFETTHPGLFKGFITLVGGNAATNQLLRPQRRHHHGELF